jgi:hypothetical protein
MTDIPTTEPAAVTAGDTLTWRRSLADFPASAGWVLAYAIVSRTDKLTITAAADGDDHLVTVPAAISAGWPPGEYTWQATVSLGDVRHTVGTGRLSVAPDLTTQTSGYDARTSAQAALDAVNAWLKTAQPWVSEYEIGDRRLKYADVLAYRSKLQAEVAAELRAADLAAGSPRAGKLYVRFGR